MKLTQIPNPSTVHFVAVCEIDETIFNPFLKNGLKFASENPAIDISIVPGSSDGMFQQLECKARFDAPVDERQLAFISGLIDGIYVPVEGAPLKLPFVYKGKQQIDEQGFIQKEFGITHAMMPADIQRMCDRATDKATEDVLRFIKLLRWRQDVDGPPQPFKREPTLYWKVSGELAYLTPLKRASISGPTRVGIRWKNDDIEAFKSVWQGESTSEPLGHELLREARTLLGDADRSALLIGFSALEVGVKQHIANVVPQASWLLLKSPSPPVATMLSKYLPKLHPENAHIQHWESLKPIFKLCEDMTKDRNAVAHTGEIPLRTRIRDYLDAVHDVLYILDVLSGHVWAKELVFEKTRATLKWQGNGIERMSFHITSGPDF